MLRVACFVAGVSLGVTVVRADVTIEQKMTLDVASMIRTHGSSTTRIAANKKREDTESHCEGMMSLVCGNLHGGEIVRLDRGLTWRLEPDKKSYREEVFATPEELAKMRAKMQRGSKRCVHVRFHKDSSPSTNPNAKCRRRRSTYTKPTIRCLSLAMTRSTHWPL